MKLIIIEQEERLADLMRRGFEKRGDSVKLFRDPNEAHTFMSSHSAEFDLLIMDLGVSEQDVEQLCRDVRSAGINTPVLALSSRSPAEHALDIPKGCADDYFEKPFSFAELEIRVAELLHHAQNGAPLQIESPDGNIALNLRTEAVTLHDAKIPLTHKEFTLLKYLLRYANTVVTRDELLEHAWDSDYPASSNVVDVHIKNVRKKLEEAHTAARIETVRGSGYRFVG